MKRQTGAALIIALSLLAVITLSVVYAMENSSIQSRMVANSVYTSRTYQATNNELSAAIFAWDQDPELIINNTDADIVYKPNALTSPSGVVIRNELIFTDRYMIGKQGNEISTDSPVEYPLYELGSRGSYSYATSNQSIGFVIQKLGITGAVSVSN